MQVCPHFHILTAMIPITATHKDTNSDISIVFVVKTHAIYIRIMHHYSSPPNDRMIISIKTWRWTGEDMVKVLVRKEFFDLIFSYPDVKMNQSSWSEPLIQL